MVLCCVRMIDRCAALREPSFLTLRQMSRSVPSWIRTCPAGPTCRGPGPGPRHDAAKAVPMALVPSAAVEPGPRGVRVNAVAPAGVDPAARHPAGHRGRRRTAEDAPPDRGTGPGRRDRGHRGRLPRPGLTAVLVRDGADARGGRRGRRGVPVSDDRRRRVRPPAPSGAAAPAGAAGPEGRPHPDGQGPWRPAALPARGRLAGRGPPVRADPADACGCPGTPASGPRCPSGYGWSSRPRPRGRWRSATARRCPDPPTRCASLAHGFALWDRTGCVAEIFTEPAAEAVVTIDLRQARPARSPSTRPRPSPR